MNQNILKRLALLLAMLCLAFALLGGTMRGQTLSTEMMALLSASFDEQSVSEEATETVPAQPKVPKVAEITQVEEDPTEFRAPTMSSYCNRQYAGAYKTYGGNHYVCAQGIFSALYPNARFTQTDDSLLIEADGITVKAEFGAKYFSCNGRYLYAPSGVICESEGVYLPADGVAKCVGGSVSLDEENARLDIFVTSPDVLENAESVYDENDVYWLSHIIYSEAGIESLEGQIAVGNVVLNRVASDVFAQQTIQDVILAKGQFDPVANGTINLTPSDEAIVAAKLVLEGYEVVPDYTLFFATFHLGEGFGTVTWIGNHCFMTLA